MPTEGRRMDPSVSTGPVMLQEGEVTIDVTVALGDDSIQKVIDEKGSWMDDQVVSMPAKVEVQIGFKVKEVTDSNLCRAVN